MHGKDVALRVSRRRIVLTRGRIVSLSGLRRLRFLSVSKRCLAILFGDGFCYVCNGSRRISYDKFLFGNSSRIIHFVLGRSRQESVRSMIKLLSHRFAISSGLRRRVLHVLLGHFVVRDAHVTHRQLGVARRGRCDFRVVHRCCGLISRRFQAGGRMRSCTSLLRGSPGALSGVFSSYGLPSPLQIVRRQIRTRTGQLLLCDGGDSGRVTSVLKFRSRSSFDHFFGGVAKRDPMRCQGSMRKGG